MADGCWGSEKAAVGPPEPCPGGRRHSATKKEQMLRNVAVRQTSTMPRIALAASPACSFLEYVFYRTCLLEPKPGFFVGCNQLLRRDVA